MNENDMTRTVERALVAAGAAWAEAHRGLPENPMTRTAAIPAIGIIAASILNRMTDSDERARAEAVEAIHIARRAWERADLQVPSNPMAKTAEKAAIGILAAGVLNAAARV